MTTRADRLIAVAIAILVTAITAAASTRLGITRDEAYYMMAGERYVAYYEAVFDGRLAHPFSARSTDPYWAYNAEHPPLFKLLYGVSWRLLHECTCARDNAWHPDVARLSAGRHATLDLLSEVTSFRLPTAAALGILCAAVYLFFVEALGTRRGGLAAALLMFAQPRAFFHAQTASFDLPVAMLWFLTVYAYWRAIKRPSWRAAIVTGILFGLALATKLQSGLLLVALPVHWVWLAWHRWRTGESVPDGRSLLMLPMIGPAVLVAVWPWLWHDTLRRLRDYLAFHWYHVEYNFEYLGRNYSQPPYPWHEPLGMLVLTAPVVLLALAAAGTLLLAVSADARDRRMTSALLLTAGAVPIAVFMRGTLPIYGATKHWLATMPFLALAAGYAVERLCSALASELDAGTSGWKATAIAAGTVAVAVLPAAVETIRSQPYGLSHYNALAGGAPGGADLGMNRQFWGYSVEGLLPWINAAVPPRAVVFFHDTNLDSYEMYLRARQLRSDIVYGSGIGTRGTRFISDAALVIHELHFNAVEYAIWQTYGRVQPAQVLTLDGVPLVSIYLRPGADQSVQRSNTKCAHRSFADAISTRMLPEAPARGSATENDRQPGWRGAASAITAVPSTSTRNCTGAATPASAACATAKSVIPK